MKAKGDVGLRLVVAKRSGLVHAPRQERPAADRRHPADVPLGVGRRRRLSEHPDGHQPHRLRLRRQERRSAQSRQPDGRRIRRPRQPDERALPHAQLHAHHPPAQSDRHAESQPARLGDEAQRQRRQGLSEPDQLQPGLQQAEVSVGQAARVRQARRPDRARPGPRPASRSTCTARSSCGRCCRYATAIPAKDAEAFKGSRRAVVRQGADGAHEGDGQRPADARAQLLLRPRRRPAAGHRPDGAARRRRASR